MMMMMMIVPLFPICPTFLDTQRYRPLLIQYIGLLL